MENIWNEIDDFFEEMRGKTNEIWVLPDNFKVKIPECLSSSLFESFFVESMGSESVKKCNDDGTVNLGLIRTVNSLSIIDNEIQDASWLKYFCELETLDIQNNNLTELDLSWNIHLKHLDVRYNKLTRLDVSENEDLIDLYCSGNLFENLNITNNCNLKRLWCESARLKSIDLSRNRKLKDIQLDPEVIITEK